MKVILNDQTFDLSCFFTRSEGGVDYGGIDEFLDELEAVLLYRKKATVRRCAV